MSLRLGTWLRALFVVAIAVVALTAAQATPAAPGDWTQAQVNTAVEKGVAFIDSKQNADGSFGVNSPPAETAFALIAYGALSNQTFGNLSATYQAHVKKAVAYLLGQQSADGSFGCGYCTYTTGLALDGLQANLGADPGIPGAVTNGRSWLIMHQNAPPGVTGNPASPDCTSADTPPAFTGSDYYCGGWNYDAGFGRSDESNTGFALTGLFLTPGGVPAATASINIGWQRHIQELQATNYYATRNDGGGDYQPGEGYPPFASNANNTGSLLFGMAYDGVLAADAKVQAALKLGNDVFDEYELMKATVRSGIYHFGMNEDGTCVIGNAGCDWAVTGDGGYHYGLWALTKGFGLYGPPENLSDSSNWYAKVVDLLLSQQNPDGSWPVDGRDDFTDIVATSFAVDALKLVGGVAEAITLTPATDTNPVGGSHTVTATIKKASGEPVSGRTVSFSIESGPNTGATGTCNPADCKTNANGQVTFTYTDTGGAGTDNISASFVDSLGTTQKATATKTWQSAVRHPKADVSIIKTGPATKPSGFHIIYTLTIKNNGPDTAAGVTVSDTLPAGLINPKATTTKGTCTVVSSTVTCNLGSLTNGETETVTIVAKTDGPGILMNTASVSSTTKDPDTSNNASTATTVVT
jgi:uncharacterized repeat protein (TIGR01451 family)